MARARRGDASEFLYEGESLCDRHCKKCKYGHAFGAVGVYCDYILQEGHRRPCAAGKECACFETLQGKRKKPTLHVRYRKTICGRCNQVFETTGKYKYCPECKKIINREKVYNYLKEKTLKAREEEGRKVKVCKLCGAEYRNEDYKVKFCGECMKIPYGTRKKRIQYREKKQREA